ncbi:MAG: glycosyl hydrolase 53 family protein [Sporocytophaga sp.]|uniref:glycosyl hydrolase 53 family protein n=1 Tax=Sporocytophaga sp. TaxID=2231183 RepID=UPI001B127608|nr:glycosyl hydrolase 53 family protein [Sporocytophaga sp.]MBO9703369.1 glycosyl hydrolase 53 family protein [Sporocytophaga sp.]
MKKIYLITIAFLLLFDNNAQSQIARGADVGWLSQMENSGRTWRDSNGIQRDLFDILDDYCINSIRLRVWVNPANGWNGKQDVINVAKRAAAKGYRLMIDFHYSDSWADPGKQTKPAAWANYNVSQLGQAVYNYTTDVLNDLKAQNITPEWVQVGNETNNGMLWPEGQASTNMANYASFVNKGYEAVKAVFPNTKVIVHVANGFDNALFRWNIGGLISNGAKFDIIGMSMYPDTPQDWQTYAQQALTNMNDMISRYNKEIMVSEIGVSVSAPQEGRQFVEQVIKNLQSLSNKKGLGIFWWEPEAYNWQGYDKVAWNSGSGSAPYQATDAMSGFKYNCENKAPSITFASPGSNTSLCQGTHVELNANATDSDGLISRVNFYDGTTLLYTDYNSPYSYTWESPSVGKHTISAQAIDNLNAATTSGTSIITINATPQITITSPANNSIVQSSGGFTTVTLITQSTSPDISSIEFYNGNKLIGNTQTNSFIWNQVPNGSYQNITAVATTTAGCKGTSSPISFEINTVTGLKDNSDNDADIAIYPNPSSNDFNIDHLNNSLVEIYNSQGQQIEQIQPAEHISFGDHYLPGIYLVRYANGRMVKVIKY